MSVPSPNSINFGQSLDRLGQTSVMLRDSIQKHVQGLDNNGLDLDMLGTRSGHQLLSDLDNFGLEILDHNTSKVCSS